MSNVVRLEYAYGVCPKCKRCNYLRYLIHHDGLIHKPYEIKCLNCNSYFAKEDILGSGEETAPKPQTNADRIRSMTDEELADWLADILNHCENKKSEELCRMSCPLYKCCNNQPSDNIEDWLKAPAEVADG